jgi:hypothetical protein
LLAVAAIGALSWKHHALFFISWTDEQIHFYVARRIAEGAVLYRDIESARPPLVLLPLAWLIRLGASPLGAGRAIVLASQIMTGGLLFWGGWRLLSWRVGILAALLFLTSPESFSRIHYTGIHWVVLTATACVLFSLRRQAWPAGLTFGLSLAAGQHGIAVCLLAGSLTFGRRPRDILRFLLGTLITFVVVFGGAWAMGSRNLWKSLVEVHLLHAQIGQGQSEQFWELFKPWLYEHAYLFAGAALAAGLLALRRTQSRDEGGLRRPDSAIARVLILVVLGHIAVVFAMADAIFLYIVVIAPLLCLLAAMGFGSVVARWRQSKQEDRSQARRGRRLMVSTVVGVIALTTVGWSAARSHREHLDERTYSFLPHVLHGQISRFHRTDGLALQVASQVPKVGTIFGDPTIASAVALASGMRISGEIADWSPMWIQAGKISRDEIVSRIEHDGVRALITPPWFLVQDRAFSAYLNACYGQPKIISPPEYGPGEGLPDILVFPHIQNATPCKIPPL